MFFIINQQQLVQNNIKTIRNEVQSKLKGYVFQLFPPQIQYIYDSVQHNAAQTTLIKQYASDTTNFLLECTFISCYN